MRILLIFAGFFCLTPLFASAQAVSGDKAQLERELADVEREISVYQNTIDDYRKQGRSLGGEIKKLDAEAKKLALEIKAIDLSLARLNAEIAKNQGNIKVTDAKLGFDKRALGEALQSLSEEDGKNLLEILFANPELSHFFNNVNGLMSLQDDLKDALTEITATREELLDLKQQLAERKTDTSDLKSSRDNEKKALARKKTQKNDLLAQTKGQESQYQELLKESQKTAAQIRSRIFEFLGGGQMTFDQAYQIAKGASVFVGVRPALLLAVLDHESALGKNVGRCNYHAAMHPTRDIPIFLELTASLGLNAETMSVSCANKDGAYGGAMGPSQFIPSTWKMYAKRIAAFTGSNPPSPWRNMDAFVATGLYLKDAGASATPNVSADRQAAARYYAGARWRNYLWTYGERVIAKARQFEEDIAALQ